MPAGHGNAEQRYLDAAYAYTVGHFAEAMAGFSELAEAGSAKAATYLAEMFLRGEGAPQDIEKGLQLLERAASWGHANAAYNLGALHRSGAYGVPKDPEKSKRYFQLAKELGCELPVEGFL